MLGTHEYKTETSRLISRNDKTVSVPEYAGAKNIDMS